VARKWDIVLHTNYAPEACAAKLAEQIDLDQPTLFSFSGYRGSKSMSAASTAMSSAFTAAAIGATTSALFYSAERLRKDKVP